VKWLNHALVAVSITQGIVITLDVMMRNADAMVALYILVSLN